MCKYCLAKTIIKPQDVFGKFEKGEYKNLLKAYNQLATDFRNTMNEKIGVLNVQDEYNKLLARFNNVSSDLVKTERDVIILEEKCANLEIDKKIHEKMKEKNFGR